MSDAQRTAEIERLVHLLMHDLRSPIGVAQGYVSLLGGDALSAEDRIRALKGVTNAIARIARLIDDAASLLNPDEMDERHGFVEASLLCERVAAHMEARGVAVAPGYACGGMKVRVGTSVDRLSEAITLVLCPPESPQHRPVRPMSLRMSADSAALQFAMISDGLVPPEPGVLTTVAAETIGSVELLKAHHHLALLQGRVLREVGETRACMVVLPLSPSVP